MCLFSFVNFGRLARATRHQQVAWYCECRNQFAFNRCRGIFLFLFFFDLKEKAWVYFQFPHKKNTRSYDKKKKKKDGVASEQWMREHIHPSRLRPYCACLRNRIHRPSTPRSVPLAFAGRPIWPSVVSASTYLLDPRHSLPHSALPIAIDHRPSRSRLD